MATRSETMQDPCGEEVNGIHIHRRNSQLLTDRILCNGLDRLRHAEKFIDVALCVGDITIPAHKVVLAAISPYFDAMFASGMRESNAKEIHMKELDPHIIQGIVDYAYTDKMVITMDNALEYLNAAQYLGIDSLADACSVFLRENIDVGNCFKLLSVADFLQTERYNTKEVFMRYTAINLSSALHRRGLEEFSSLGISVIKELVRSPEVQHLLQTAGREVDKTFVQETLLQYVKDSLKEKRDSIATILPYLHLSSAQIETLQEIKETSAIVKNILEVRLADECGGLLPYKSLPAGRGATFILSGDMDLGQILKNRRGTAKSQLMECYGIHCLLSFSLSDSLDGCCFYLDFHYTHLLDSRRYSLEWPAVANLYFVSGGQKVLVTECDTSMESTVHHDIEMTPDYISNTAYHILFSWFPFEYEKMYNDEDILCEHMLCPQILTSSMHGHVLSFVLELTCNSYPTFTPIG